MIDPNMKMTNMEELAENTEAMQQRMADQHCH